MFLPREDSAMSERTAKSKSRGLPPPPCGPRSTSPGKVRTFFVAFRYVHAVSNHLPQARMAVGAASPAVGHGQAGDGGEAAAQRQRKGCRESGQRRGEGEGKGGASGGGPPAVAVEASKGMGRRRKRTGKTRRRRKRLGQYSSAQSILLVGDGNFSFSLALATAFGSGANLVATSLDTYGLPPFHRFRFLSCPVKLPPARQRKLGGAIFFGPSRTGYGNTRQRETHLLIRRSVCGVL